MQKFKSGGIITKSNNLLEKIDVDRYVDPELQRYPLRCHTMRVLLAQLKEETECHI